MPPRSRSVDFPRHLVTAVLVAHNGAAWLPEALAALQWQRRPPQRIVAIDTGSTDDSRAILSREIGVESVLTAAPTTGYGDAVAAALAAFAGAPEPPIPGRTGDAETVEWVWLLHDDCAPMPDALRNLLELADASPSAAVIGPKVHAWSEPGVVVEVGFTVDTSGRRDTGLEAGELDQGQHDGVGDVLAVGTAGALVRRDVWDTLGGLDPQLPLFRDDLDFCWRAHLAGHRVVVAPRAVVRHDAAGWAASRPLQATANRPRRVDRAHALYTLLVNLSAAGLVVTVPRLMLGAVVRALGMLIAKRVGEAVDELAAVGSVLAHPGRIRVGRRQRAATRQLPHRAVRPLLAKRSTRLRHYADVAGVWLADRARGDGASRRRRATALETGPSSADDDFDDGGTALFRSLWLRPGPLLVLGLVIVALVAERSLLGAGSLVGGRLLAADSGARDLWSAFFASWHPVAQGSDVTAPPYLAGLALLSTAMLGKAWLAVDVIMLGCVPLAGLTAYVAAGRITREPALRVWAGATYALLPVATGVVAAGRLGDAVAFVLLPVLLLTGARVLTTDPRFDGWRHVWATGLLLAFATAFAPILYVVALPLLIAGVIAVRLFASPMTEGGAVRRTLAATIVTALPLVLLWPWTTSVLTDPGLLLRTPGPAVPALATGELHPSALAVAWPGGPGAPPVWLMLPLLAAGLAGLVRLAHRRVARVGWAIVVVALVVGILVAHARTSSSTGDQQVVGWPGVPAAVLGAGLIIAALVAADGSRERLRRMSFSWRQPVAVVIAVTAALVPVMTGVAWLVRGADDPVERVHGSVLPAFITAESATGQRPRVLVLHAEPASVSYELLRDAVPRIGDADLLPDKTEARRLDAVVAELTAGRGGDVAAALSTYGAQYVLLTAGSDPSIARILDGTEGLARVSTAESVDLWELTTPAGRMVVLPPAIARTARGGPAPTVAALTALPPRRLASGPVGADVAVPAGPPGRLLVLAEQADSGWRAEVDGVRLPPVTAWGWAQGFELPARSGQLRVWHDPGSRRAELLIEGVLAGVVLVLAWPAARRRGGRPQRPGPSRQVTRELVEAGR